MCDKLSDDLCHSVELRREAVRLVLNFLIRRATASCLQVVTLGLEVCAIRDGDLDVVYVGAVVWYELHLDALYEQRCIARVPPLA